MPAPSLAVSTVETVFLVGRWPGVRAGAPRRNVLVLGLYFASVVLLTALFEWIFQFIAR